MRKVEAKNMFEKKWSPTDRSRRHHLHLRRHPPLQNLPSAGNYFAFITTQEYVHSAKAGKFYESKIPC